MARLTTERIQAAWARFRKRIRDIRRRALGMARHVEAASEEKELEQLRASIKRT